MGQGRRRRAWLMWIEIDADLRVESISAPVDDRRGWQTGGAAQNRGTCRAAAGHGAAGHGYGWKMDGIVLDYASVLLYARLDRKDAYNNSGYISVLSLLFTEC